jgi:hypothetical protein
VNPPRWQRLVQGVHGLVPGIFSLWQRIDPGQQPGWKIGRDGPPLQVSAALSAAWLNLDTIQRDDAGRGQ